jgi:hypothetical protein
MPLKALALTIFLGLFILKSSAQNVPEDTLLYSSTAKQVIDYFNTSIAEQSEIYNGAKYELYPPANKGTFYFLDKNYCVPSLIRYNGTWFKNIPVLYDVHNDAMISVNGNNLFVLDAERTSDIYLLDHHFIYLNTKNPDDLAPGFYDLLYDGRSQVLVKRTKLVDESKTTEIVYEDKTAIYVKKDNKYLLVSSKGTLMDIFKSKRKELNQYLKSNKIKYNKDEEGAVARLASYYDQISN